MDKMRYGELLNSVLSPTPPSKRTRYHHKPLRTCIPMTGVQLECLVVTDISKCKQLKKNIGAIAHFPAATQMSRSTKQEHKDKEDARIDQRTDVWMKMDSFRSRRSGCGTRFKGFRNHCPCNKQTHRGGDTVMMAGKNPPMKTQSCGLNC
ncbi:hypothetical protein CBL_03354 [Carabus blaptoides fortunei]